MDTFDAKLPGCPRELGFRLWVGILGIDAEDAVFVAIQRDWQAVRCNVVVQDAHISQRGLGGGKAQLHQVARGIVDKHQQSAVFPAPLKPVVRGAVDLDQLTQFRTALTHRMNAYFGAFSGFPKSRPHHHLAGTLDAELDAMSFMQLLAG